MMYRTHCQRMLDTVVSANFEGVSLVVNNLQAPEILPNVVMLWLCISHAVTVWRALDRSDHAYLNDCFRNSAYVAIIIRKSVCCAFSDSFNFRCFALSSSQLQASFFIIVYLKYSSFNSWDNGRGHNHDWIFWHLQVFPLGKPSIPKNMHFSFDLSFSSTGSKLHYTFLARNAKSHYFSSGVSCCGWYCGHLWFHFL